MKEKFEKPATPPDLEEMVIEGKKYLRMGGIFVPILDENGNHVEVDPDEQIN